LFEQHICSTLSEVDASCQELRRWLEKRGLAKQCFAVELVAREALNNAVLHGNGNDPGKAVHLRLVVGRVWIRCEVTDQGPGFDWRKRRGSAPDANATHGRGLLIYQQYATRFHFNPRGNQITFWIRIETPGERNHCHAPLFH
jgi:anti-sigma regulatory factor (Ser/Thr protein kinase)